MRKRKDKKKKKLHEIKYPWMAERKEKKNLFFLFFSSYKKNKKTKLFLFKTLNPAKLFHRTINAIW